MRSENKHLVANNGSPVAVSSDVTINSGGNGFMPSAALRVNYRFSYFLDELRFMNCLVPIPSGTFTTTIGYGLTAALQVGQLAMTGTPVYLSSLGPVYYATNAPNGFPAATYICKLSRPLFVQAGEALSAQVFVDNASPNGTAKITMTAVGRAMPPGFSVDSRDVPWFTSYNYQFSTGFGQTNDEFRNPFTWDLSVHRFGINDTSLDGGNGAGFSNFGMNPGITSPGTTFPLPVVKLWDSYGYIVVPDNTALGDAFSPDYRTWPFERTLGAREKFNLQVRNYNPYGNTTNAYTTQSVAFSMIGSRKEAV